MILFKTMIVLFLMIFEIGFTTTAHHRFDYRKEAQKSWHEHHELCGGKYQSPINIVSHRAVALPLPALERIYYQDLLPSCITNTGHSVSLKPQESYSGPVPRIFGAALDGEYILEGLHFHWGHRNSRGSEHVLSGIRFPIEMHIIHRKMNYPNVSEALKNEDGLTVLAFFFQAREQRNRNLRPVIQMLKKVRSPGENVCLRRSFALSSLLESSMDIYYTYQGSLTTPPCSQAVRWIVFPDPLYISYRQIRYFRRIRSHDALLRSNYRLPHPLNGRIVYKRLVWRYNRNGHNRTNVRDLNWYKVQKN